MGRFLVFGIKTKGLYLSPTFGEWTYIQFVSVGGGGSAKRDHWRTNNLNKRPLF